jgi:diguanylate cyclase (GGDEF)-like protein
MTQVVGLDFALLEQVLHVLPDAAIGCDAEGRIVSGNEEACDLVQACNGNFEGQKLSTFFPALSDWEGSGTFLDMVRLGVLDAEQNLVTARGGQRLVWSRSRLLASQARKDYYVVITLRDVTARSLNERRLREMAVTDGLTGLHNRRYLDSILDFEEERAQRYGFRLVCAFIDLDRFKDVNDRYGHAVGDKVIQAVAGVLKAHSRKIDSVVRWGGDEFVMLMLVKDSADARVALERLVNEASNTAIRVGELTLFVTISCGAVISAPGGPVRALDLIQRADELLLLAKTDGRNRLNIEELSRADS